MKTGTAVVVGLSLVALGGAAFVLFGKKPSPEDVFKLEVGKRYRYTVTSDPKLDDAGVATARTMLAAQGMTNFEVLQGENQTIVTWDAPPQTKAFNFTRGQTVLSLGGVTYAIDNVQEIPAQAA